MVVNLQPFSSSVTTFEDGLQFYKTFRVEIIKYRKLLEIIRSYFAIGFVNRMCFKIFLVVHLVDQ